VTSEPEEVLKKAPPSINVTFRGALTDVDKIGQTLKNPGPGREMISGQTLA
jgi:hypothetical protein